MDLPVALVGCVLRGDYIEMSWALRGKGLLFMNLIWPNRILEDYLPMIVEC